METEEGRKAGFKEWVIHIWNEGLARKLVVDREGKNLVRLPLTLVVIGAVVAPWLAAIGAVVAVVTGCRLAIELDEPEAGEAAAAAATSESAPPPPPPAPPAVPDESPAAAEVQSAASDESAP